MGRIQAKSESGKRKAETQSAAAKSSPKKKKLSTAEKIRIRVKACQPKKFSVKMGRPSVYSPEFCKQVIEFMARGYSLTAFAGTIGVSRETIYAWMESHKDFSDALAKAKAARTFYWEKRLEIAGPDARAVIFALRNSCADEWKNNPDENGVSVTVQNDVSVDLSKPPEEWGQAELEAELKRRGAIPSPAANGHNSSTTAKPSPAQRG